MGNHPIGIPYYKCQRARERRTFLKRHHPKRDNRKAEFGCEVVKLRHLAYEHAKKLRGRKGRLDSVAEQRFQLRGMDEWLRDTVVILWLPPWLVTGALAIHAEEGRQLAADFQEFLDHSPLRPGRGARESQGKFCQRVLKLIDTYCEGGGN